MDFKEKAQQRIRKCQENKSPELDLNDLELQEVPPAVWDMDWLKILKLGVEYNLESEHKNQITQLPPEIAPTAKPHIS